MNEKENRGKQRWKGTYICVKRKKIRRATINR